MGTFISNLQQMVGTAWRSSAIHPLMCLLVIFGVIAIGLRAAGSEAGMFVCLALMLPILVVALWMFVKFGNENPDMLRSERYNISRMAINAFGDSESGALQLETAMRALNAAVAEREDRNA